jgi:hypothetical protein
MAGAGYVHGPLYSQEAFRVRAGKTQGWGSNPNSQRPYILEKVIFKNFLRVGAMCAQDLRYT